MPLHVEENVSLRALNSFGVDARARYLVRVRTPRDLAALEEHKRLREQPRLILGGGSNVLFTRDFDGVVLRVELPGLRPCGETEHAWLFEVGAGENWHQTVERLLAMGRPGLENLALIPGTVGAAPIQNIGAYGLELAERFHALTAWDFETRSFVVMNAADCDFGYRDSVFKRALAGRRLITAVTLALPKRWQPVAHYADVAQELAARGVANPQPRDIFEAVIAIRRRKLPDPAALGNAGSFFKNPVVTREQHRALIAHYPSLVSYALPGGRFKLAAGWLIEAAGLKGATRGRAGVYERQALVLVNRGGAAGAEILALAREVQEKVRERFGIWLEPEPVVV
ncbi:MAG: UDP-N-acetylmuramate dehydrogenase [Sutterellaceae bacterium]|nr:UDP-N-acetylmuramate dehydrogenase [Burkholderiaceae bacterium]MDW8430222.1 UDP-N-acetylmuramate dehydrogenase [Sutterellaceae bacterium]